jgi:hypothetical protein
VRIGNSEVPFRRLAVAKFSPFYTRLRNRNLFSAVENFCMFIGYGRSGSSLVGALLNAHPNAVMSNELNIIDYIEAGLSRESIFNLIYYMSRRQAMRGSKGGGGYTYAVPNQWQGQHREIQVIGDRKAGGTAIQIYRNPELVSLIQSRIGIPIRFVHVVRNPFDTLATTVQKTVRLNSESEENHLRRQIGHYFDRTSAIEIVKDYVGGNGLYIVYHEDLIENPRTVLKALCRFVGLQPGEQYLNDCTGIIRKEPHFTRNNVRWTSDLITEVRKKMGQFPWLARYDDDLGG